MKKLLKLSLSLIGIVSIAVVIYYRFAKKCQLSAAEDSLVSSKEEKADFTDFLDLSNLKFSHHYVDLR